MTQRILFIGTLHHPEQLQKDLAANPANPPLFPSSTAYHFWEKALKKRGYVLDVFWRNLPGYGKRDVAALKSQRYTNAITPGRVAAAAMRRLPPQMNLDYRRRNALLLEHARHFQPDIVWMIGDNTIISADTLEQIKQLTGALLIYATGTSPIVFSHPVERAAARLYDLVLVNDYYHGMQWMELGAKQMVCLPLAAVDPEFHAPKPLSEAEQIQYECDVGFVGTLLPDNLYSERVAALEALHEFKLGIWSVHDVPQSLKVHYRGYALGEQMLRVLSGAKISLNVHGDFMRYGGNMRLFEAAAVGAFQIVDERPGIHEWFTEDEHLVIFRDHDDLRDKVRYYLAHPEKRASIAEAARAHVIKQHTYEERLDKLEQLLDSAHA